MQVFDRRLHRQFWRGEVLLTRTINGGIDNMPNGLGNFTCLGTLSKTVFVVS